jgi:TetR/AcrR family transcriptional repressor of nem operon
MKDEIIKLAQQQMKEGGYENLSFAKIAEDLSTTRANLHHHFKNKEGLALQATQHYIDETSQNMMNLINKNNGNFAGFLNDLEDFFIKDVQVNGRRGSCVCGQLVREPDIPDSILKLAHSHYDTLKSSFEAMIKESQDNGSIAKSITATELSYLSMSMLMGLSQLAMVHGDDPKYINEIKGTMTKFISAYKV